MGITEMREVVKLMRELGITYIKLDGLEILLGQEPQNEPMVEVSMPVDETKLRRESLDGLLDSERVDLYTSSSEE